MTGLAFLAARDGSPKTDWHEFFDDFDNYTAGDWTITETGSGTRAIGNLKGGVLVITNAAADNDANFLQWQGTTGAATAETFKWQASKRMYFGTRCKLSDVTQSDFFAGLYITDTDPVGGLSDGIYFRKDDGDAYLDFIVAKDSVSTGSPTAIKTLANDTYYVLEWYYDGNGLFTAYVDGIPVGKNDDDFAPDDEELALSFGIQNGEAVAKVLSVDWVRVVEER